MTIDIIMPCYYSNEIIRPALNKIANQTMIKDITLIMVNDCSPNTDCEYQDLIQEYQHKINIRYLKTDYHMGPGDARQLGLDNATGDWVTFHDDDDELYDKYVIESYIRNIMEDPENIISISGRVLSQIECLNQEYFIDPTYGSINNTLFKREILQKLNIHFEHFLSFREEDGCFRDMFELYTRQYKRKLIDTIVYIHKVKDDHVSLTSQPNQLLICFLNLMGFKAFILKYLMNLQLKNNNNNDFYEGIMYVPHLLLELQNYLHSSINEKLNLTQWEALQYYIQIYLEALTYFQVDYNTLDQQKFNILSQFLLNGNEFYGKYKWENIITFPSIYKSILEDIKNNYLQITKNLLINKENQYIMDNDQIRVTIPEDLSEQIEILFTKYNAYLAILNFLAESGSLNESNQFFDNKWNETVQIYIELEQLKAKANMLYNPHPELTNYYFDFYNHEMVYTK